MWLEDFSSKRRRAVLGQYAQAREGFRVGDRIDRGHYTWIDSPSDGYFSHGDAFFLSFKGLIPNRMPLREYVETILKDKKGQAIGIEFGGPGSNFFNSFTQNFFSQTAGVTLVRSSKEHPTPPKNHTVLEGDIISKKTYEFLGTWLAGKKADLIVERMGKGLEFIPPEPFTAAEMANLWYEILAEGGVMFVQVPVVFNNLLKMWAKMLQKNYAGLIEIRYAEGIDDSSTSCSSFSLRKFAGAPTSLPLLHPKALLKGRVTALDNLFLPISRPRKMLPSDTPSGIRGGIKSPPPCPTGCPT